MKMKVRDLKPGDVIGPAERPWRQYVITRIEFVPVDGWQEGVDPYEVAYIDFAGMTHCGVGFNPDEEVEVVSVKA